MELENIFNTLILELKRKKNYNVKDVERICLTILEEYLKNEEKKLKILREFYYTLSEIEEIISYGNKLPAELMFRIDTYLLIMEIFAEITKDYLLKKKITRIILLRNRKRKYF